ncbi:MAG TPA: PAS domain S-box protein, partial [Methylomirabilota bacterium]|nr:PAS domain S-box protein [Methylomirabilota bacterium]
MTRRLFPIYRGKRREHNLKGVEWGSLRLPRVRGVTRTAILLGALTALSGWAIGYFAYTTSREATLKHVYESNLNLARTISAHALLAGRSGQEVLGELERFWGTTKQRYRGSYLCVVGPSGQLLIHTARPEHVGTDVGAIPIDSHSARDPKNLRELVEAKQEWAGYYTSPDGREQVAAFVYVDRLNALVGVHVPSAEIEAEIRASALPWAVGVAFISVVLLPLSLGLLHWGYTASDRAAGRAMAALRESEGRLRAIFENSAIGIALTDLAGRFVVTNRAYQAMLGYSDDELRRLSCSDLTLEEFFEANDRFFTELKEGKRQYFQIEKQYRRGNGNAIWVRDTVSLVPDPDGKPQFAIALIEDITERKRAEEALRESEERFKAQYKGIPIPTYTWRKVGNDYVLIDYNDAAAVFTRGRVEDLVGRNAKELYKDTPDILDDFLRCVAERTPVKREMHYRWRTTG